MSPEIEILLLILGLMFSAFFSGSEAVLMSISVDRTRQLIDEGGARGNALKFLARKPNHILTTILVGNNLVNVIVASLTTTIAQRYLNNDALSISIGVTTIFILIFGEIIPKTFARTHAEALALPCIIILRGTYWVIYPIVAAFMFVIETILGKNAQLVGKVVTQDDIEYLVNKAEEDRSIDSKQLDLLNSILEFPKIKVKDIMVSRQNIEAIQMDSSFDEVISLIREVAHSRYPVYDEDIDETIGFLHVKDLAFVSLKEQQDFQVSKYLKPPFFVYEHMKIQAVFDHMNRKKVHLALVKDENGIVVGIVTLEDIMEEIFGEIQDEHDDEEDNHGAETAEGVIVPASISLRDLYNEYDIKIPLNDNYSTLTGFLLENLGNNFPKKGNVIFWEGLSFELISVRSNEIIDVKIQSANGDTHIHKKYAELDEEEESEEDVRNQRSRQNDDGQVLNAK